LPDLRAVQGGRARPEDRRPARPGRPPDAGGQDREGHHLAVRSRPLLLAFAALLVLAVPEHARAERIGLNAAGDVSWPSLALALDVVDAKGPELFALTRPLLAGADLNFANLECPFTRRATTLVKTYSYACDPHRLDYLLEAGFNLFSLSNNHALDA